MYPPTKIHPYLKSSYYPPREGAPFFRQSTYGKPDSHSEHNGSRPVLYRHHKKYFLSPRVSSSWHGNRSATSHPLQPLLRKRDGNGPEVSKKQYCPYSKVTVGPSHRTVPDAGWSLPVYLRSDGVYRRALGLVFRFTSHSVRLRGRLSDPNLDNEGLEIF